MKMELNVGNIVIVTAEHPDGSSANTHGDIGIITVKEKVTDEVDYTVHTVCSDYMYDRDQLRLATQEEIENEFRRLLTDETCILFDERRLKMESMSLNITFGYEMDRAEVERFFRYNGLSWEDFDNEEAYIECAKDKFNVGLGCEVEVL